MINNMRLPLYLRKKLGGMSIYQIGGAQMKNQPQEFKPMGAVPIETMNYREPALTEPITSPLNNDLYRTGELGSNPTTDTQKINPIQNVNGNWMVKQPKPDYMGMGRDAMYAANPLLRMISEMHAQGQQEDYEQTNTANPLANLAYNDGRSSGVKYGYDQYAKGGRYRMGGNKKYRGKC